jgi:hypothetical protein
MGKDTPKNCKYNQILTRFLTKYIPFYLYNNKIVVHYANLDATLV